MDLKKLIKNNMALLDAELDNKEALAEQKIERQHEALNELFHDIVPILNEAGYHIALFKTRKYNLYKTRCHEDSWSKTPSDDWTINSEEMAKMIQIEFPYSECLKNTGESEDYYVPKVRKHNRHHSSSYSSAYVKISWDDAKGVYFMVPNVAYNWNNEREDVDKRVYLELHGTKDMIIERLAVVLANVMRLERNFKVAVEKDTENEHR
jgi:hypothetical protein